MPADLTGIAELLSNGGDLDSALDKLAAQDPLIARLVATMRERRRRQSEEPAPGSGDDRAAPVDDARAQALLLAGELDALRNRNRRLAHALGACECFGERAGCDVCAGAGRVGAYQVDLKLFNAMIAPALEQVRGVGAREPRKEDKQ